MDAVNMGAIIAIGFISLFVVEVGLALAFFSIIRGIKEIKEAHKVSKDSTSTTSVPDSDPLTEAK